MGLVATAKNILGNMQKDSNSNAIEKKDISIPIRMEDIKTAIQQLDCNYNETNYDIVFRNKLKIKEKIKEICEYSFNKIEEKSFVIIDISKDKLLNMYFSIDKDAFIKILNYTVLQYGLKVDFNFKINNEDNTETCFVLKIDKIYESYI